MHLKSSGVPFTTFVVAFLTHSSSAKQSLKGGSRSLFVAWNVKARRRVTLNESNRVQAGHY